MKSLTWVTRGKDYYYDSSGRFDVMLTGNGDWLAVDAGPVKTERFAGAAGAMWWCAERAMETDTVVREISESMASVEMIR